jgi:hypothetical protein
LKKKIRIKELAGSGYLNTSELKNITGSRYFKPLKEPPVFMKEGLIFSQFFDFKTNSSLEPRAGIKICLLPS